MNRTTALSALSTLAAAVLALFSLSAQAADEVGPYAGAAIGRGSLSLPDASVPLKDKDGRDTSYKLFGGYRLNENFSLEAGYARLGKLGETATIGGTDLRQQGTASSLYAVGVGRLPVNEQFAFTGRLGLARNKVSGTNVLPAADSLQGSKNNVVWGLGAEYKLSKTVALTADYDNYGKVSDKVKASTLMLGIKTSF
ncbi:porin family protein [Paucibacter sp. APW11]|uniref:Porin family protein n=1 Tax=Roseateles aquae TaxID=3077235 RepID=A0ABU3PG99_9BURK|nr:porin family protein [Paucibacter sp. APW11]MDT9000991.1 porin family protein [Paucibacter sp. APW11]